MEPASSHIPVKGQKRPESEGERVWVHCQLEDGQSHRANWKGNESCRELLSLQEKAEPQIRSQIARNVNVNARAENSIESVRLLRECFVIC